MKLLVLLVMALVFSGSVSANDIRLEAEGPDFLMVYEGNTPVFRYVRGEILAPGVPEDRRRSTYVHPLYSLDGKTVLTDDFPADHHHHRGLSWMWMKVTYDGTTKDLWTLKGVRHRYVNHSFTKLPGRALLKVDNQWLDDASKKPVLDEQVYFYIHPVKDGYRVIDYRLRLSALDRDVKIDTSDTGYSGLGIRFAPRERTIITTPEGVIPKDENRTPHKWAALRADYGVNKERWGVAIIDHPLNPYGVPGWTLRPYGYLSPSFTNWNPGHTIKPGRPLNLYYRIVVYSGETNTELIQSLQASYTGQRSSAN